MSLTKLALTGNYKIIPARESLVSDIPAGDEKRDNLFYSVKTPKLTSAVLWARQLHMREAHEKTQKRRPCVPSIIIPALMREYVQQQQLFLPHVKTPPLAVIPMLINKCTAYPNKSGEIFSWILHRFSTLFSESCCIRPLNLNICM
jgi:hypothetical protein